MNGWQVIWLWILKMLYTHNIREKHKKNNPYSYYEQSPKPDAIDSNWRDEDPPQEDIQYHIDYSESKLDSLREKRQIDITPLDQVKPNQEMYLTPLYAITAFFSVIFLIGPFLVRKGPNRGIVQASIMLTAFCMWIFWFTIYFGQMNPLMGPRLENTTVAWIAYKLGNPLKRDTYL